MFVLVYSTNVGNTETKQHSVLRMFINSPVHSRYPKLAIGLLVYSVAGTERNLFTYLVYSLQSV